MIVGGPNQRKDFHVNPTEEFFYQLEGDMVLRVMDENTKRVDIPIREGEVYLLPRLVPHSPQRGENTIGMVVEVQRPEGQLDHLRYYCDACDHVLFDPTFYCTDLGSQLKPLIEQFRGDEALRTCDACGHVMEF
jgi:3-hydroxyanthranilate 3,4-dioxygenase